MLELRLYRDAKGQSPLVRWIDGLQDARLRAQIRARLTRLAAGSFGDCKPLREGLLELRIALGEGHRVYFSRQGPVVVLLLSGSGKSDQKAAIRQALAYLEDWKQRGFT
jgi:putative addiction module killer protein